MGELRDILERLLQRRDLAEAEAADLLVTLTDPAVAPAMSGALLAALRAKGVTPDEVRDASMREHLQIRTVSIVRPTTIEEEQALVARLAAGTPD